MDAQAFWSIAFTQLCSMRYHPRNEKPIDLGECAELADKMLAEFLRRYG